MPFLREFWIYSSLFYYCRIFALKMYIYWKVDYWAHAFISLLPNFPMENYTTKVNWTKSVLRPEIRKESYQQDHKSRFCYLEQETVPHLRMNYNNHHGKENTYTFYMGNHHHTSVFTTVPISFLTGLKTTSHTVSVLKIRENNLAFPLSPYESFR